MDSSNTQTQPAQVESPVQEKSILSKKNSPKKIFWIFFLVAILIAFTAGGFLLGANSQNSQLAVQISATPTINPTANWQTYKNEKYGFEFKYPAIFTNGQTSTNLTYQGVNLENLISGKANNLKINIYPSLKDYRLADNAGGFVFYFDINSRQWMHDKTTEASKFTPKKTNSAIESYAYNTGDVSCRQEYILIPTPKDISMIELINEKCTDDNGGNLPGYYNLTSAEILSTFKFTDQSSMVTSSPSITVIFPNGGDKLTEGGRYVIKWSSVGIDSYVDINLLNCEDIACKSFIRYSIARFLDPKIANYNWIIPSGNNFTETYPKAIQTSFFGGGCAKIEIQTSPAGNLAGTRDLSDGCVSVSKTTASNPVIDRISPNSGSIGASIEISGKNFNGFEGDLNAFIENSNGIMGVIHGDPTSSSTLIKFTLKSSYCNVDTSYSGLECPASLNLVPGIYKIYVKPWGVKSNETTFSVIKN